MDGSLDVVRVLLCAFLQTLAPVVEGLFLQFVHERERVVEGLQVLLLALAEALHDTCFRVLVDQVEEQFSQFCLHRQQRLPLIVQLEEGLLLRGLDAVLALVFRFDWFVRGFEALHFECLIVLLHAHQLALQLFKCTVVQQVFVRMGQLEVVFPEHPLVLLIPFLI